MRKGHSRMLRSGMVTAVLAASVVILVTALLGGCGQFAPSYMKPLSAQTRALLAEKGMTEDALKKIDQEVRAVANEAAEFATHDPEPDVSELYTDVYR